MTKKEIREKMKKSNKVWGDMQFECEQLHKIQAGPDDQDIATLSAACSSFLTLVCC